MNVAKRVTKNRLIGLLVTMILPLVLMVLGVIRLRSDIIFNRSFAVVYFIIPLSAIALCAFVLFSAIKRYYKILLLILIIILFGVSFYVVAPFGTFEHLTYSKNGDIGSSYIEVCEKFEAMPSLDDVGEYLHIEYYDYSAYMGSYFDWYSDILVVQYNEQEYQREKAGLDEKYVFQTTALTASGYSCEPNVWIGDYYFRVLDLNGKYPDLSYPKKLFFVGINDNEKSISYIALKDDELDYIDSLEEYLWNDAGWKHVN